MKNKLQKCRFSNLKSITAKVFLTFALFCSNQQLFAQLTDDFSDGDFVADPVWSGSDARFIVESGRLSLKAPADTDAAYLATTSTLINDATWEFLVQLDFNPSTSNFVRIYLVADRLNLSGPLNGYFIELGNVSDDVRLYRQSGNTITPVIDGANGKTDLTEVTIRIKVHRANNGLWELYTDPEAAGTYSLEGSAVDEHHLNAVFLGIFCTYTSMRSDKFHFDDFSVKAERVSDLIPPELTNVKTLSPQTLQLTFSEQVETASAVDINNYHINGIGHPANVTLTDGRVVELTFEQHFAEKLLYVLLVSGVTDINGNMINTTEKNFQLFGSSPLAFRDIIFTEVFADPSPSVALPDVEYVEILNKSENTVSLDGWTLSDGANTFKLKETSIAPGEYVILTSNSSLFPMTIKSIGSGDFPSLNNSDDHLMLADASDNSIDSVHYTIEWYKDDKKSGGGWSLEIIDPYNDCAEEQNWIASEHPSGGTPGMQNSVLASKPDLTRPTLVSAIPLSLFTIRLFFNEKMQQEVPHPDMFAIEPHIGVKRISIVNPSHGELLLELTEELSPGVSYVLTVKSITDCAGNEISETFDNVTFGLPEEPLVNDVLINEIMFDPRPGGVDFVEIVNASDKFFNLKNWTIGNFENDTITQALLITTTDLLLPPRQYLAFTEDLDVLKGDYPSASEPNILEVDDLPSFNDDAGSTALMASNQVLLDHFTYSTSLHSVFINDPEGVSLERIAFTVPANDTRNWKSASTASGYATPGYLNSNSRNEPLWTRSVQIEPEVFIPIYGQPDFVQIHYVFDHGGYVATVRVFDAQGHLVKQIATGEVLGTAGSYRWDGDRDDGSKARVGYYMVSFEVFDDTGEVRTFFNRVVVATRF